MGILSRNAARARCRVLFLTPTLGPGAPEPVLIHKARGGPEAPITHHSRTLSSQEGTMHKLTKSPGPVITRAELLHNSLRRAFSTNCTCHTTPRGHISEDEPLPPPVKDTGVQCSGLELRVCQCMSVCGTEPRPDCLPRAPGRSGRATTTES